MGGGSSERSYGHPGSLVAQFYYSGLGQVAVYEMTQRGKRCLYVQIEDEGGAMGGTYATMDEVYKALEKRVKKPR
jgi:hypothetical protein